MCILNELVPALKSGKYPLQTTMFLHDNSKVPQYNWQLASLCADCLERLHSRMGVAHASSIDVNAAYDMNALTVDEILSMYEAEFAKTLGENPEQKLQQILSEYRTRTYMRELLDSKCHVAMT